METKKGNPKEEPKRRRFLKLGGLSLLSLPFLSRVKITFAEPPPDPRTYWEGAAGAEYCVSRVVKSENAAEGVIRARIDRVWREYPVRELDQKFWDWEFSGKPGGNPGTPY